MIKKIYLKIKELFFGPRKIHKEEPILEAVIEEVTPEEVLEEIVEEEPQEEISEEAIEEETQGEVSEEAIEEEPQEEVSEEVIEEETQGEVSEEAIEEETQEEVSEEVIEEEPQEEVPEEVPEEAIEEEQQEISEEVIEEVAQEEVPEQVIEEESVIEAEPVVEQAIGRSRTILDCEFVKPYEKRLANVWEKAGIISTEDIDQEAVSQLSQVPNIGETSIRTFLSRFKGYVEWEAVSGYYELDEWDALEVWKDWVREIVIKPEHQSDSIGRVFVGNTFNKWIEFCEQNNIAELGDLTYQKLQAFKDTPGVGKGKFTAVQEIVAHYTASEEEASMESGPQKTVLDAMISFDEDILDLLGDVAISKVLMLVEGDLPQILMSLKLSELQGYYVRDFVEEKDSKGLYLMVKKINGLPLPDKVFDEYKNNPKNDRSVEVIEQRFLDRYTLEKVGDSFGVTRERVRQLQKKAITQIELLIEACRLGEIIRLRCGESAGITRIQMMEILGEHNDYVRGLIECDMIAGITYHQALELYLPMGQEVVEQASQEVRALVPEIFKTEDYMDQIGQVLEAKNIPYDQNVISKWLDDMGYYRYGNIASLHKFTHKDILQVLFQQEYLEPLYIDEQSVEALSQLAKTQYGYEIEPNVRAVDARIRDVKDILLVESRTYLHIKHVDYPEMLVERLRDYLEA
ncbi:MAG: sigma factor-like helix-turn-helix DNA-binding protein, partial [Cellulosilyticaceae bacterium]